MPELDDSPIASGEVAGWVDSFFRDVGNPEISCDNEKDRNQEEIGQHYGKFLCLGTQISRI